MTYHRPALFGDVVTITTLPQALAGVRGLRRTEIHHAVDGALLTEVLTEWVWVRASTADRRGSRASSCASSGGVIRTAVDTRVAVSHHATAKAA